MEIGNSRDTLPATPRQKSPWMKHIISGSSDIAKLLQPETSLEKELLRTPEFQQGLMWGEPRFGHPEGKVVLHVREILDNIERLPISSKNREQLRLIAFVHDTFKYMEPKDTPRRREQHHAVLARQFIEHYSDDPVVLKVTELHDEAFYIWRRQFLRNQAELAQKQLPEMLNQVDGMLDMYYYFFRCDTMTGDKLQSPLHWFQGIVKKNGVDPF